MTVRDITARKRREENGEQEKQRLQKEIRTLKTSMKDRQVKLLRVLDDGEYTPLGDTNVKKVNVRIIAATNRARHSAPQPLSKNGEIRHSLTFGASNPRHFPGTASFSLTILSR
jgi:transcriptional regulator with PAS, ATPase and Fis domain